MRTVVIHPQASATTVRDMKIGDIAVIDAGVKRWGGHVFLRHYEGWVSLNEPGDTWSNSSKPDFKAHILTSGTQVILEVE